MDHISILKRAWHMMWRYRALWVFGIILALTASSGSGGSNGAQFSGGGDNGQGFDFTPPPGVNEGFERLERGLERLFQQGDWAAVPGWFLALVAGACGLGLILAIGGTIARYVSETAAIRMVDTYEATGEKKTVRQGFRMGWSRAAWRLFLIGFVVTVPIVVGAVLVFGLAGLPLLAWTTDNVALGVFGTVVTIGFFFLAILALIVIAIVATVLVRLAWRAAALDDLGVRASLRRGWALIRSHLGDVGLMWLIMLGINLGYGILMIPVALILVILGGALGGLLALLAGTVARLFTAGAGPWIIGGALGVPIFFLVLGIPLTFLEALHQVFQSSVWTLTYRELTALEALAAPEALAANGGGKGALKSLVVPEVG